MNDRLRIPQDADYFKAIGLAAIAFARLEWNAVWCCERLQANYITTIEIKKKTAGVIGRDLKNLFSRVADSHLNARILPFAQEFCDIVEERNSLLHGKPGTANNGDQRLFRHGVPWSIADVDNFSDRCARAAAPLNSLLYAEFKAPCTVLLNP